MNEKRADYLIALLELQLDNNLHSGLTHWQTVFTEARANWQLPLAQRLLYLVKRFELTQVQRAAVRRLEGQLQAQQGYWEAAVRAYTASLQLNPQQAATLSDLGNALRHIEGHAEEAVSRLQQALTLAAPTDEAAIRNNLGMAYYEAGDLDSAYAELSTAVAAFQEVGQATNAASALHNLGSLNWTRGRLAQAEQQFSEALAICEQLGDRHAAAETRNSLGLVQEARGEWQMAANSYRAALQLLQQDGDDYGQAQTLANLGNALTLLGQLAEALTCFQSGLAIAADLGDARLEGQLLTGLADLYLAQQQYDQALTLYNRAIERKQAAGDRRSLKHTWLALGTLYRHMRRPHEAQAAGRQALALARAQQDRRVESHALLDLARLAVAQEQLDAAPEYLDQAYTFAVADDYPDVMAEVARLRGDLELLQPQPDYHLLLRHYTQMLADARAFNNQLLRQMLDYLIDLLAAIAADGQPDTAAQIARDIATLGIEVLLPEAVLDRLRAVAMQ